MRIGRGPSSARSAGAQWPAAARAGTELRAGAKFCDECGTPVARPTGQAAQPDPRSYTPKHLADKILQSKSGIEGERKLELFRAMNAPIRVAQVEEQLRDLG